MTPFDSTKCAVISVIPENEDQQFIKDCFVLDHVFMIWNPQGRSECAFTAPFGS